MSSGILLVAGSGLAREALSVFEATGQEALGILDDNPNRAGTRLGGVPVVGPVEAVSDFPRASLVLCAGKGSIRRAIAARLAALGVTPERYATIVDPTVRVPSSCSIGAGTILLAHTVLTADVSVGAHVVCMPHVTLTHDDVLDDFATLASGVTLGGGVRVGEAAYLGMNAAVREQRTVGAGATLGMSSALLTDQPANSVWAGVPARELKKEIR